MSVKASDIVHGLQKCQKIWNELQTELLTLKAAYNHCDDQSVDLLDEINFEFYSHLYSYRHYSLIYKLIHSDEFDYSMCDILKEAKDLENDYSLSDDYKNLVLSYKNILNYSSDELTSVKDALDYIDFSKLQPSFLQMNMDKYVELIELMRNNNDLDVSTHLNDQDVVYPFALQVAKGRDYLIQIYGTSDLRLKTILRQYYTFTIKELEHIKRAPVNIDASNQQNDNLPNETPSGFKVNENSTC